MSQPRRRAVVVLVAGLLPWTVLLHVDGVSLVFAFGLVDLDPPTLVTLPDYLFVHTRGLPRRLEAWPAGVLLYAGALACAMWDWMGTTRFRHWMGSTRFRHWMGSTRFRRRDVDPRLTGGLLVFSGFLHAHVSFGLRRLYGADGPLVLPVGAIAAWAVAWWYYWPLVRERGLVAADD